MATNSELATLYVSVRAKTDELEKSLSDLKSKTEGSVKGMSNNFKGLGTELIKMGAIVQGVRAGFDFLKGSIKASRDHAIAMGQVSQAILQTGGSAGYTSGQLERMADKLEAATGFDGDDILKGVSLQLLTFGNVQGEVFAKAQTAALDLSAVLGTDLKNQTIQLGKALEDPIKGINSLSRAGVTFTEVQKENIRELVKQNDLYAAQSIILTEIEAKYGEQAKALHESDKANRDLTIAWNQLQEAVGDALTPLLNDFLPAITKGIKGWISLLKGAKAGFEEVQAAVSDNNVGSLIEQYAKATAEQLEWAKKESQEQLSILEKRLVKEKENLKIEAEGFKLSGKKSNELALQVKQTERLIQFNKDNLKAVETTEKKRETAIANANKQWSVQGKTVNEIKDRITELQEAESEYEPNDAKRKEYLAEIDSLTKLISKKQSSNKETNKEADYIKSVVGELDEYRKKIQTLNTAIAGLPENSEKVLLIKAELTGIESQLKEREFELGIRVDTGELTKEQEDYIKGITETLDVYRDRIKLLNDQILALPENTEARILLTAELKDTTTALADKIVEINVDPDIESKGKEAYDKLLKVEQEYNDSRSILTEEGFNIRKAAIEREYQEQVKAFADIEALTAENQKKMAALKAEVESGGDPTGELNAQLTKYQTEQAMFEEMLANKLISQQAFDEAMKELGEERQESENAVLEAQLDNMNTLASAMGGFASLAQAFGEKNKGAYKALATSEAIIATYLGAAKALGAYPPPFGAIAAAGVIASGLANVAKIASAHSGGTFENGKKIRAFSGGGDFMVPPGFPNDTYPLLVESGERVQVTPKSAMQSGGTFSDRRIVEALMAVNKNISALDRRVSSVEIDGKELAKIIIQRQNDMDRTGLDTSFL